MIKLKTYATIAAFLFSASWLWGHGGEDHETKKKEVVSGSRSYFTIQSVSELYELVLRYEPIQPKEHAHFKLFVSDYKSNKPIDRAALKISSTEDPSMKFDIRQLESGIYEVHTQFQSKKTYSLNISINSNNGPDLMAIENIEIGKMLPTLEQTEEHEHSILNQSWFLVLIGFIGALLLVFLFNKLSGRKSKATFLMLLFIFDSTPIPTTFLRAHGGEDHGETPIKSDSIANSNVLEVPKETQFLFDIWTKKIAIDDFTESTELFGTIIPSSSGQAVLSSPQNGKITRLVVQVGQRVKKGQQIAVVEQNIDAVSQVSLMAEKNNINAEYDAAKVEYERLKSIADIASKRELSESESRFKRAKANKQLFNSNSGKSIVLKSPIDGVIGNFNYSLGSTVVANETLFTVTNLSKVYVEAQVFDKDGEKIKKGIKYTVQCTNDNHKTAEVKLIALAQNINSTNQSQRVLFEMENTDESFKIGEFVSINAFASSTSKKIAIPKSSITQINGKSVVFVKDDAEKYRIVYVFLGEENGNYSVVEKGITEGDRIVINGSYSLKMMYINQ